MKTIIERFEEKFVKLESGCWEWTAAIMGNRLNRGCFYFDGCMKSAPRVSHILYIGKIPENMCVCHTCDNSLCVNPSHLWLGTQQDNVIDMMSKGRGYDKKGVGNPMVKLTESQVMSIRIDSRSSLQIERDGDFGSITAGTIRAIRQRRIWAHLIEYQPRL